MHYPARFDADAAFYSACQSPRLNCTDNLCGCPPPLRHATSSHRDPSTNGQQNGPHALKTDCPYGDEGHNFTQPL